MSNKLVVSAALILAGGCVVADDDELGETEQQSTSDASTRGGTRGFYFLPSTAFTGSFDGSYGPRSGLEIKSIECMPGGTTGGVVYAAPRVRVYPAIEAYKVTVNVAKLGLRTNHCYRVVPLLDDVPLGYRDVQVTKGTPLDGYARWTPGSNQPIKWRLEDMDPDLDGEPSHVDNCPTTENPLQEDSDGDGAGDACEQPPAQTTGTP